MNSDRRAFLKTAASGAVAGGCTAIGWSAAGRDSCGAAIGTYGLQSMPVADAIRLVAETGYDAVEITVFSGTTGDPKGALNSAESRAEVRGVLEDAGLRLCALMAHLQPEKEETKHQESLGALAGLTKLARDLAPDHPPLIQTVLGGKKWEESKNLFRDRLADWMQLLADEKGVLSIKPHRSHAMSDPVQAAWLLGQLGNPDRVRMVYDFSHYAYQEPERSIADTVAAALPITNYIAVKDALKEDGKVRFALAGESGNWDLAEIVRRFFGGGYRGDFCCEVSSQIWRGDPDYDPVAATKTCYRNLGAAFERAGVARG